MSPLEFRETAWGFLPIEGASPLCSTTAAFQEAQDWVQNHNFRDSHVIILGLGAGFHLKEWFQEHPLSHVTVIETREGLTSVFFGLYPELKDKVQVLVIDDLQSLERHELIDSIVEEMSPILCFRPSWGERKDLFEKIFSFLTARSPEGLTCFLQKLGESNFQVSSLQQNRLLTIKDLGLIVEAGFQNEKRAHVVRILKELLV